MTGKTGVGLPTFPVIQMLQDVEQDTEKVHETPGHNKQVEDGVDIALLFPHTVENCADGVSYAAQDQEHRSAGSQDQDGGFHRYDNAPAHGEVTDHGEYFKALHIDGG